MVKKALRPLKERISTTAKCLGFHIPIRFMKRSSMYVN